MISHVLWWLKAGYLGRIDNGMVKPRVKHSEKKGVI